MDLNQQKEQFSRAYVRMIAAAAGFDTYTPGVDDDSIDMGIAASGKKSRRRPRLELQLKCTAKELTDGMQYPLALKNYNDLRCDCWVPRILVVVTVPERPEHWVAQTADQLLMHCRAYWASLAGHPEKSNTYTVTVELPSDQLFSVNELNRLMNLIDRTGRI
jgi:hypothetical protein